MASPNINDKLYLRFGDGPQFERLAQVDLRDATLMALPDDWQPRVMSLWTGAKVSAWFYGVSKRTNKFCPRQFRETCLLQ